MLLLYLYITMIFAAGTALVDHSTRRHVESLLWCPAGTSCTALWVRGGKCYALSSVRFHVKLQLTRF